MDVVRAPFSRQVGQRGLLHQLDHGLAHGYPREMHWAGRTIGAAIAPEDAAIKNVAALHRGKNIRHFNVLRMMGEGIAANRAVRSREDPCLTELLEDFCQEARGNSGGRRHISQLNRCAESLFRQDHQPLDRITAFFAQLHLWSMEQTDKFSPLAKAITQSPYHGESAVSQAASVLFAAADF